jgi:colanic acid biosynthesis glycosyl transferase WcaI
LTHLDRADMRILIHCLNFSPEPTGVGKYVGEMADWLALRGHEIHVVTSAPHYPQYRVFDGYSSWRYTLQRDVVAGAVPKPIEVRRCPVWVPQEPRGWRRILHLASFALGSVPVMLKESTWRPDVVLVLEPTLFCAPTALAVARLSGATSWLHVQDFEVDAAFQLKDFSSAGLKRWVLAIERRILSKFDRVSAISERMVERLHSKGVPPARAALFPNWVDTAAIFPRETPSPLRRELGIPPEAVVALCSGSMGKKQGLELITDVSHQLSYRPDLQFVFSGEGSYRETLALKTKSLKNVITLPLQPVERLNDLLNLADIHLLPQMADAADLVMPSRLTGMMSSGRPTIATAHPGTQLFHAVQGRGLATTPGDAGSFIAALLRLVDDPILRHQLGDQARKFAVDFLNRDQVLASFEHALLESCGLPPRSGRASITRATAKDLPVEESLMTSGKGGG